MRIGRSLLNILPISPPALSCMLCAHSEPPGEHVNDGVDVRSGSESAPLRRPAGGTTIERLEALPDRDDARAFLERAAALMQRARMPAQDISPFQAEMFASIASHLLPGCWGGRVPPITLVGRHVRIDQLVRKQNGDTGRLLDVACGFPPFTTIDSSSALPRVGHPRRGSIPSRVLRSRSARQLLRLRRARRSPVFSAAQSDDRELGGAARGRRGECQAFEALLAGLLRERGNGAGRAAERRARRVHAVGPPRPRLRGSQPAVRSDPIWRRWRRNPPTWCGASTC